MQIVQIDIKNDPNILPNTELVQVNYETYSIPSVNFISILLSILCYHFFQNIYFSSRKQYSLIKLLNKNNVLKNLT